jgi:DNA-binding NarL/FixJ family response regulator
MIRVDGTPCEISEPERREIDPGELPTRLRLLCVGSIEPSWVGLTLQLDARGCVEPSFNWVSTANEALALLRDESFDCLLIRVSGPLEVTEDDPLLLARGIRAGGCGDPVVVVTRIAADETWREALQLGVDLLVSAKGWESTALVPAIQRAVERGQMLRDIDRLTAADRRRLVRERDEAEYLLQQQQQISNALTMQPPAAALDGEERLTRLPAEFDEYYQELVRTYVIMGSGSLMAEIARLAQLLAQAQLSPREVFDLHLARVGHLVRGLGNRSTRHVMARADLLALELMIQLGECYQRRPNENPSTAAAGVAEALPPA